MSRPERIARIRLTDLNRETTAKYLACNGQHIPSGAFVERDFPSRRIALPICKVCGVPYGKQKRWGDYGIK